MVLIFVRHGRKSETPGIPDSALSLTAAARAEAIQLAAEIDSQGLSPRLILHSTYRHARETAALHREAMPRGVRGVTHPADPITSPWALELRARRCLQTQPSA